MKISIIIVALLFINPNLFSQIKIVEKKSDTSKIESEAIFMDADANKKSIETGNKSLDSMRLALRNFDYDIISTFLNKGLQNELNDLKNILDEYAILYNSEGEVYFKDQMPEGNDVTRTSGYITFENSNKTIGSLEFWCTYKGKRPILNDILILKNGKVEYEFPLIFGEVKKAKETIRQLSESKDYDQVILNYKELLERTSEIEIYYENPLYGLTEKSNMYGNIAKYYALTNNPTLVIQHAKKGLEIWSYNYWINANLVLGYALNNDFENASKIYTTMGNEWYKKGKYFKEIFLSDLKLLNDENIVVPHYSKYLELLNNL